MANSCLQDVGKIQKFLNSDTFLADNLGINGRGKHFWVDIWERWLTERAEFDYFIFKNETWNSVFNLVDVSSQKARLRNSEFLSGR